MYPYMFLRNKSVILHSGTLLLYLTVISAILMIIFFAKNLNFKEKLIVGIGGSITGLYGARLFHVLFERLDYFKLHPGEIFTKFDGMTFYGTFLGTGFFLICVHFFLFKKSPDKVAKQHELWDMTALSMGIGYFLMRIGCFLSGCCWGKMTAVPWNVRYYDPRGAMPYLGIPVHPTQLYDAFLGLLMFGICIYLKTKKRASGNLMIVVLFLYPIGRFITEFFRGDSYRGENIIGLFSTSQTISIGLLLIGIILLIYKRKTNKSIL